MVTLYLGTPDDVVHSALTYLRQVPQITLRIQKSHKDFGISRQTTSGTETQPWTREAVLGYDAVDVLPEPNFHPFGDIPLAPDDPNPLFTEPQPEPGTGAEGYTTLEKAVFALGVGGKKFGVDPALRSKPVSVYGARQVKPGEMLTALANVYGLRVGEDDRGKKTLYRPLFILPLTLADMLQAARHAFPEPLLRTLPDADWKQALVEEQKTTERMRPVASRTQADWALLGKYQARVRDAQRDISARPRRLHLEAVARLQAAVEAQLIRQGTSERADLARGSFTSPVRLSSLPASAQGAFGITFMTETLDNLQNMLGQQIPEWVGNIGQCYLMGGPVPNPDPPYGPRFKLWVEYAGPDGTLSQTAGVDSLL